MARLISGNYTNVSTSSRPHDRGQNDNSNNSDSNVHRVSPDSATGDKADISRQDPPMNAGDANYDIAGIFSKYDVRRSSAYRTAYEMFKDLNDQSWMHRLNAIVNSDVAGKQTFFDKIGVSTSYEDQLRDNYNHQVTEIQNLIAEYQAYVQGLPVTQVQQLANAGYNASITGQGLTPSAVNPSLQSTEPTSTSSNNPLETIGNLANIATSTLGGFATIATNVASIYKSLNDVKLARKASQISEVDFATNLWKEFNESGYNVGGEVWKSVSDINNYLDLNQDNKQHANVLKGRIDAFETYRKAAKYEGFGTPAEYERYMYGDEFSDFYRSIADFELNLGILQKLYDSKKLDYDSKVLGFSDPALQAERQNTDNQFNIFENKYNSLVTNVKADYLNKWIDQFNTTKDPVSKFAILKTVMSMDIKEFLYMNVLNKINDKDSLISKILYQLSHDDKQLLIDLIDVE